VTPYERADFQFLAEKLECYYEFLDGDSQQEVDRIWREYELSVTARKEFE